MDWHAIFASFNRFNPFQQLIHRYLVGVKKLLYARNNLPNRIVIPITLILNHVQKVYVNNFVSPVFWQLPNEFLDQVIAEWTVVSARDKLDKESNLHRIKETIIVAINFLQNFKELLRLIILVDFFIELLEHPLLRIDRIKFMARQIVEKLTDRHLVY